MENLLYRLRTNNWKITELAPGQESQPPPRKSMLEYRHDALKGIVASTRELVRRIYPDLYGLQYNDHIKRLRSFIERLNQNISNQLSNLASGEETLPWTIDHELNTIVKSLKPEVYPANTHAPTICTVALGSDYKLSVARCLRATQEYCARHQYNYLLLTESALDFHRPYAWMKVCLLFYALERGYKNIMWLDADALITNFETKLESFYETLKGTGKSMLITEDHNGINTGVFYLGGGWKSRILLNLIWCNRLYISHVLWEQAALMDLMRRHAEIDNQGYIEPICRKFNSCASELATEPNTAWQPGDFIVHFAGVRRPKELSEFIAKYSEL